MPYGDTAVLVELDDPDAVLSCYAALADPAPEGTHDIVPAARTILVHFDRSVTSADAIAAAVRGREWKPGPPPAGRAVELRLAYDGPDLPEVADALGWSVDRLVNEHQERTWRVAFAGFLPGFGYLLPDGDWPTVARRPDPRTSVPSGSVALADRYSGVYPRSSPGGWQLIGRTAQTLWNLTADPPALLVPGTLVRFVSDT